jgi:hypothetical protein
MLDHRWHRSRDRELPSTVASVMLRDPLPIGGKASGSAVGIQVDRPRRATAGSSAPESGFRVAQAIVILHTLEERLR